MANKYYYLVSSLPYMNFEGTGNISKELFLSECKKWLTDKDFNILLNIDTKKSECRIYKEYKDFDMFLREELGTARESRIRAIPKRITRRASHILNMSNPLEMEKGFERARWSFLEELEIDCDFDLNWLILYLLKLKIHERINKFNREEGQHIFDKACEVEYA